MNLAFNIIKSSSKSDKNRLLLTSFAVGLGFLIILFLISGVNALISGFNDRGVLSSNVSKAFMNVNSSDKNSEPTQKGGKEPILFYAKNTPPSLSKWKNTEINIFSVKALSENSVSIPGLKTPKSGEFYVSPALDKVMKENSDSNLNKRFGDKKIGLIPDSLLQSPDDLSVVRGVYDSEVKNNKNFVKIYDFKSIDLGSSFSVAVSVMFIMGATILLTPIVLFVVVSSKIGFIQRERRYSALRLAGATRKQIVSIVAFESILATLVGVLMATIMFFVLKPFLAYITFGGKHFWPEDITPKLYQYIFAVFTIVFYIFLVNIWGIRKVQFSPLGVTKSGSVEKKPRIWRIIPIIIGSGIFLWFINPETVKWLKQNPDNKIVFMLFVIAVLLVMVGLLFVGPWFANVISRFVAKKTNSALPLLVSSRIKSHSASAFRVVGGVVLALFAGSFYITAVSGVQDYYNENSFSQNFSKLDDNVVVVSGFNGDSSVLKNIKQEKGFLNLEKIEVIAGAYNVLPCSNLGEYTNIKCPSDKKIVAINFYGSINDGNSEKGSIIYANNYQQIIDKLKKDGAYVEQSQDSMGNNVNGNYIIKLKDDDAIERIRGYFSSETQKAKISIEDFNVGKYSKGGVYVGSSILKELAVLTYFGMAITLIVAILSLIMSTVGGLYERKQSLYILRLCGVSVNKLRLSVLIESVIPLISVSIVACGLGFWMGGSFINIASSAIKTKFSYSIVAVLLIAILVSVVSIWIISAKIKSMTNTESNRTE